ncbi:adaptin N terminal region-domain-containing protein [Cokeromyces recurvatus]|uniref:adaptin N terminal region-domain-containing protein n=1 Tax=Cokeromyces recurvatus TaxID=90255 RepID=UPI0022202BEC|nr:adaptin N terminal region-domain-containing protein [Cokeromyces recurvatus]KAI7904104.1 adaptin N terminal region-domain-containing protein [Cokeromyces recurvatus]
MATDLCYTLVYQDDATETPSLQEFQRAFEKGSDETRIETMKKLLVIMLNGDPMEKLLLHVIRFVLPSRNKQLKKLLQFYWEICPKTKPDGKLKDEFILVCNALMNDLQHPNEYIRGSTLRFLCKIKEPEVLEPLVPSVRACLEHRHSYVRKNAVFAIGSIYKTFDHLFPDAPEVVQSFLLSEADMTCRRNAFVVLCNVDQALAVQYLLQVIDSVPTFDELLQLAVIELIRKDSKNSSANKAAYIRCLSELLAAASHSVKYEAAAILLYLTTSPAAVKAAASCYIELIVKESDNNVKLIVLDRLEEIRNKHDRVLDDLVMDILQVLNSPDIDVRRKAIRIALEMVSSRNVQEVVLFLKKELTKTQDDAYEKNAEYRQLLIQSIHTCAIKFSEVAANVVHVLMEFLGDSNNPAAVDVVSFVREVVEKFPGLRESILEKLLDIFTDMKSGKVFRGALWIIGEYCETVKEIDDAWKQIRQALGEIPLLASEQKLLDAAEAAEDEEKEGEKSTTTVPSGAAAPRRILADGTYASESAYTESSAAASRLEAVKTAKKPPLRSLILAGDYFLSTVLSTALTKLVLRYSTLVDDATLVNTRQAEAMLIMTSILRVGQSKFVTFEIDEDSYDRIMQDLRIVGTAGDDNENNTKINAVYLQDTREVYSKQLQTEDKRLADAKAENEASVQVQVDDVIAFRQFEKKSGGIADEYDKDLSRATGTLDDKNDLMSKLNRIVQLTGFSDKVYAEAVVNVHQYDILMDVLIVNQTNETLQNLTVEFATLGDLKLVDRPATHNLAPHSFLTVKAPIKVSSTETGVIFGNIVYDSHGSTENCVVLNDIHIDIMDYINPAYCNETQFRSMWTEFEWENKVNVNTTISDLREYLQHIMDSTNMSCLTPKRQLEGDCGFLSANMYARSIFGEDALANLSIEKSGDGPITGHIRIRSKTQGIALSLGDKITLAQKIVA